MLSIDPDMVAAIDSDGAMAVDSVVSVAISSTRVQTVSFDVKVAAGLVMTRVAADNSEGVAAADSDGVVAIDSAVARQDVVVVVS